MLRIINLFDLKKILSYIPIIDRIKIIEIIGTHNIYWNSVMSYLCNTTNNKFIRKKIIHSFIKPHIMLHINNILENNNYYLLQHIKDDYMYDKIINNINFNEKYHKTLDMIIKYIPNKSLFYNKLLKKKGIHNEKIKKYIYYSNYKKIFDLINNNTNISDKNILKLFEMDTIPTFIAIKLFDINIKYLKVLKKKINIHEICRYYYIIKNLKNINYIFTNIV